MRVAFFGYSDDNVEVEGPAFYQGEWYEDGEEYGAWADGDLRGRFFVLDENNVPRLQVLALYDRTGCWSFAAGKIGEESEFPEDWTILTDLAPRADHSTLLSIEGDDLKGVITQDDWDAREAALESAAL